MSLNWKEIDLILEEWKFRKGKIQQIIQTTPSELYLEVYPFFEESVVSVVRAQGIYINLTNSEVRIHSISHKVKKAKKAQRFQQLLQSRVMGARINNIIHVQQDRILKFEISRVEESEDNILQYNLYIKLWSNQANIVLTTKDDIIIDLAFRRPKQNLIQGERYILPDIKDKSRKKEVEIRQWNSAEYGSFNEYIDMYYRNRRDLIHTSTQKEKLTQSIRKQRHILELGLDKIRAQLKELSTSPDLKCMGDIILSNAHSIKKGLTQLVLEFEGTHYNIILDEKLDAYSNAEMYYKKSKKSKRSIELLKSQELLYLDKLCQLNTLEENLNIVDYTLSHNDKKLLAIEKKQDKKNSALISNTAKSSNKTMKFVLKDKDFLFVIGRNLKENDELLRHFIKGKDMWLHVRGNSGAYVFIRSLSNKSTPLDILIKAGQIAALYSKNKHDTYADVYYTEVKYLKRIRDTPGLVSPSRSKTLQIKINIPETKKYINAHLSNNKP